MLVKELISKLNSYNMDALVRFECGDNFDIEIEIVPNQEEIITDNGNTKEIIIKVIKKVEEPVTETNNAGTSSQNEVPSENNQSEEGSQSSNPSQPQDQPPTP